MNKKYFLHFNELGSYDDYDKQFDTLKEAKKELEIKKKEYPEYYTFIAKIVLEERNPQLEE